MCVCVCVCACVCVRVCVRVRVWRGARRAGYVRVRWRLTWLCFSVLLSWCVRRASWVLVLCVPLPLSCTCSTIEADPRFTLAGPTRCGRVCFFVAPAGDSGDGDGGGDTRADAGAASTAARRVAAQLQVWARRHGDGVVTAAPVTVHSPVHVSDEGGASEVAPCVAAVSVGLGGGLAAAGGACKGVALQVAGSVWEQLEQLASASS